MRYHRWQLANKQRYFRPSEAFKPLHWIGTCHQFPSFALPSKIKTGDGYDPQSKPLAGWRIVVKDNIRLRGTKTSQGNKAYYHVYDASTETAPSIQKLIDKGAVVVGKTKMNSFANWEEPIEYTDYQAPWNPRGDQYQSMGGSSSGSAAAVAAYDWLDIAIGTDSRFFSTPYPCPVVQGAETDDTNMETTAWGSVTRPALWCGCFGLRPTMGAVSEKGIEPLCESVITVRHRMFDRVGLTSRGLGTGIQRVFWDGIYSAA